MKHILSEHLYYIQGCAQTETWPGGAFPPETSHCTEARDEADLRAKGGTSRVLEQNQNSCQRNGGSRSVWLWTPKPGLSQLFWKSPTL